MNLRVLRFFLTVAKEQSFTKAAEQLNLTQPTLSRQLAALEEELGAKLFDRGGRSITLTGEGVLLKRRALEIVEMEDKILSEFKGSQEFMEGTITIGCGEFMAVETLAEISTEEMDYIRLQGSDHWVLTMRADDPLAAKEYITKEDLIGLPLILPERHTVQSELANWFGKDFSKLQVAFTSNLGTNAGVMVLHEGAERYWEKDKLVQRRLTPKVETSTVIAWRRNIPYSPMVSRFIEEIQAYSGGER